MTTARTEEVVSVWKRIAGEQPELDLDLSWLDAEIKKGIAARPGKHGLTVEEIQVGSYGDVPDETDNYNGRPRGAARWPCSAAWDCAGARSSRAGPSSVTLPYEEAQQRQRPAPARPLAILLGGGKANIDEGYKILMAVQAKQQKEFAQRLKVIGLTEMADGSCSAWPRRRR